MFHESPTSVVDTTGAKIIDTKSVALQEPFEPILAIKDALPVLCALERHIHADNKLTPNGAGDLTIRKLLNSMSASPEQDIIVAIRNLSMRTDQCKKSLNGLIGALETMRVGNRVSNPQRRNLAYAFAEFKGHYDQLVEAQQDYLGPIGDALLSALEMEPAHGGYIKPRELDGNALKSYLEKAKESFAQMGCFARIIYSANPDEAQRTGLYPNWSPQPDRRIMKWELNGIARDLGHIVTSMHGGLLGRDYIPQEARFMTQLQELVTSLQPSAKNLSI